MNQKRRLGLLLAVGMASVAMGRGEEVKIEGDPLVNLKFDARFDGTATFYGKDDAGVRPASDLGFTGSYLNLVLDGEISDKFSYGFRYRMYKDNGETQEFFKATDWAYLKYQPTERWSITAGKQVVMVGTIEYDYAPIDVYFASDFWNHINPYQIGVAGGYEFLPGNTVSLQLTNSPYAEKGLDKLMAYNVFWNGHPWSWLNTLYSANLMEYQKGHYINFIALGHRAQLGKVGIDVDYINRYGGRGTAFFKDFTVSGKVDWQVTGHWNLFAKGGYDQNKAQEPGCDFVIDRTVLPGVDRGFYGAGVEYSAFADARNQVRLHAMWHSSTDRPHAQTFLIGVRWQMNAFKITRK